MASVFMKKSHKIDNVLEDGRSATAHGGLTWSMHGPRSLVSGNACSAAYGSICARQELGGGEAHEAIVAQ